MLKHDTGLNPIKACEELFRNLSQIYIRSQNSYKLTKTDHQYITCTQINKISLISIFSRRFNIILAKVRSCLFYNIVRVTNNNLAKTIKEQMRKKHLYMIPNADFVV